MLITRETRFVTIVSTKHHQNLDVPINASIILILISDQTKWFWFSGCLLYLLQALTDWCDDPIALLNILERNRDSERALLHFEVPRRLDWHLRT